MRLLDVFAKAYNTRVPSGMNFEEACEWLDDQEAVQCALMFGRLKVLDGVIDVEDALLRHPRRSYLRECLDVFPRKILLVRGYRRHDVDAYWTVHQYADNKEMCDSLTAYALHCCHLIATSHPDQSGKLVVAISLDSWLSRAS